MTKSERIVVCPFTLPTLQRVEDGLALVLGGLEGGGVFAVDEQTSDGADQEPGDEEDKVGHRLRGFGFLDDDGRAKVNGGLFGGEDGDAILRV
jgi:hypothetical protein